MAIGNRALMDLEAVNLDGLAETAEVVAAEGGTPMFVAVDGRAVGMLAVADTLKPESAQAVAQLEALGLEVWMLTGDNRATAEAIAAQAGIDHVLAEVLPEQKAETVKLLQSECKTVAMVGDGINDAPALARADVGAAMGVAGTDAALDAADLAPMREDWSLVPDALLVGRRSARTIRQNLYFTAAYNLIGIALAAVGILPPVWAAAAQSLPDAAILANSSRLLRPPRRPHRHHAPSEPRGDAVPAAPPRKPPRADAARLSRPGCAERERAVPAARPGQVPNITTPRFRAQRISDR